MAEEEEEEAALIFPVFIQVAIFHGRILCVHHRAA